MLADGGLWDGRASPIILTDLPNEILINIVGHLDHPRDLLAVRMSCRLFEYLDVASRAAAWALCPEHAGTIIRSRAPSDIVAQALPLYVLRATDASNADSLLEAAVRGGRIEVVRLVHQYIASPGARCNPRRHDVYRAACIAASRGDTDILRYILTRTFGDVKGRQCGWGVNDAARTGNVDVFAFAHDMFAHDMLARPMSDTRPCQCDKAIGRAAWYAGSADVALWMRDFGCAGYCPPTIDQLCEAIIQGYDTLPAIAQQMGPITDPALVRMLNNAVARINPQCGETIAAAFDCGLPIDPTAALVGGAAMADVETMAVVTERFPPNQQMVRAAIVASTFDSKYHGTDGVAWLVKRWPEAVDAMLVTACILQGALDVVRLIEPLVRPPYDWQRAAGAILASQRVDLIDYAIKQKGVVMDETIVLTAGFVPRAKAAAYLAGHYGLDRAQALYNMGATLWRREPAFDTIAMPLARRDDGLCLEAYRTVFWAYDRNCESSSVALSCGCNKCSTTASVDLRPPKRQCTRPPFVPLDDEEKREMPIDDQQPPS